MLKNLTLLFISFIFYYTVTAQNYVTLHDQCDYSGKQYTLEVGRYRAFQMKIANDRLTSIQIPAGMKVTIYEHDKFEGRYTTYTSSIPCLDYAWRNMASSILVENLYGNQPGAGQNDFVTFYNDCYSRGYSQSLRPGTYTGSQLGVSKYNISSFVINGNLRIRAYLNNDNLSGAGTIFETSQTCLSSGYSDKIGSLIIEYINTNTNNPSGPSAGSGNYATLYTDCNYSGNALRLMPGTYQGDKLGLIKYNSSSIELASNLRARVYIDNEFLSGSPYLIEDDMNCMSNNLKNRIGSIVIEEKYGNGGQYPPPTSNEPVIIYTDGSYRGQAVTLLPGTYSTMAQLGFPDNALSSLKVPPGYRVVLYEFEDFKGKTYTVTESRSGFSFSNWNDKTSSIAVYRN